ncbi:SDR family NAD(P)-dependent oxidoreductase [Bosea sp. 2YAB26]|uniref:SDR family NAD(P)-dependent oxidoreductase n=1 Tax=Bosea sp. 2YAB26 TaxID=3237478 RepID=UPI003F906BB9
MTEKTIAVVTGGASGIGAACCRELAKRGARIVILDRDLALAESVAAELGGHAVQGDVGDEEGLRRVAARIEAEIGPVGILVNSAGVLQPPLRPTELPMAVWDHVIHIDQRGTYLACVVFGAAMLTRRAGSIVNIASITGSRSVPLHAYAPAKAAVIAITRGLAAEWGPAQVRVNSVSPGYTRTPALQAAIDKGERDITNLVGSAALGRLVEPDEVARVVAFLASPDASAITGIDVPVDCGWLAGTSWHSYGGFRDPGNGSDA